MLWLTAWVLLHGVLAVALTLVARRYALSRSLIDQPGERRSHAVATPRGGGISVVVVTLLAVIMLAIRWPAHAALLACFAVGLLLVAAIGWLDDHRPLSPGLRLLVQGLAGVVLGWGLHASGETLTTAALAIAAVMVLVNVWNFMDGIDGLASSQALLAAAALGLVLGSGPWAWLAAAVAAALAGFLPFNFPRARIFLGDVGSGAIGYVLAALLVAAALHRPAHWALLLLPVVPFLVDASFTLSMRIMRGEQWWSAHVQHTYQRWAQREGRHVPVTLAYGLFSFVAGLCMLWALGLHPSGAPWIGALWCGLAGCFWTIQRRKKQ